MIKGKEQCLVPEYILKFLEKLYLGIVPEDYGQRMVSRKLLSKMKALYHFYNDKIPSNFGRLLCPEYLIDFIEKIDLIEYTDEDTAYIKEVPAGSLKYAFINAWGGMSYKSENLIVLQDVVETTLNGITYSCQNGVITLNGTATANFNLGFEFNTIYIGTYSGNLFASGTMSSTNPWGIGETVGTLDFTILNNVSNKTTSVAVKYLWRYIASGNTFTNYKITPMLVVGSTVPTTWKQGFTDIRNSAVTSVVSKDSNNTNLDTLTIPAEVQAIEGYSWGVNSTCYNYIDFDNKKFIKNVARVDLGSLDWSYSTSKLLFYVELPTCKPTATVSTIANLLTALYTTVASDIQFSDLTIDKSISCETSSIIRVRNTNYSTIETFKTAMTGVYLYYEQAEQVETDITDLMPSNFGYIEVRPEGKVIFNNEYEQAVPSMITYLVEV